MNTRTKGTLCLLLTSFIWGLAFVAQRVGADYLGPFAFNGVRFALGALSLMPLVFIFERKSADSAVKRRSYLLGLGAGLIIFAASTLQQFGIQITGSAGKSGFITGLYTVFVPIIGVFIGKKTTRNIWLGAVLAVLGLYFLSFLGGENAAAASGGLGDAVLVIGSVILAVHILYVDRAASGGGLGLAALRFSMAQFAVCAALSLACAFIFEHVTLSAVLAARAPILYGGLASVGVAYTLQIFGQRYVEPARAAILFSLETLFGALGGAVLLGERMRPPGYLGCALIFAGIIVSQMRGMKKPS